MRPRLPAQVACPRLLTSPAWIMKSTIQAKDWKLVTSQPAAVIRSRTWPRRWFMHERVLE